MPLYFVVSCLVLSHRWKCQNHYMYIIIGAFKLTIKNDIRYKILDILSFSDFAYRFNIQYIISKFIILPNVLFYFIESHGNHLCFRWWWSHGCQWRWGVCLGTTGQWPFESYIYTLTVCAISRMTKFISF